MYAMGCCGTGVALMSNWLGTRAARGWAAARRRRWPQLQFPLVPAPYEGRPWFLPVVGECFRLQDKLARRSGNGTDRS